jgi:hypothetical protein
MSRRWVLAACGCVLAAPPPAGAASAASVSTPEACYSSRKPVDFAGSGFRARAHFVATVGGRQVTSGSATRFGDVSGSFQAPVPTRAGPGERVFTLRVSDGVRAATTRFRAAVFGAGFSPTTGDPATLRVRFFAYDFGTGRTVYLHYLRPDLTLRTTIALGVTRGPCGTLASARLRIFPFYARPGNWRLQLDTSRVYARLARPRVRLVVPVLRGR